MRHVKFIIFFVSTMLLYNHSFACGITFKKINKDISEGEQQIRYISCTGEVETVLIKEDDPPLLFIPKNKIENIEITHELCLSVYQPFGILIKLDKTYLPKLKQFSRKYYKKQVAVFIDNEIVSLPIISFISNEPEFKLTCFTLEKAVMISINLGFKPRYNEICVNKKKEIRDLISHYKFKDKKSYKPVDSFLWIITKNTTLLDNLQNKKPIMTIPANKIVEQYFNEITKDFEKKGNYIKVIYQNKIGWIKRTSVISFFSTLDHNIFLQKFFENNELYSNSKLMSQIAIAKIKAIREFYIKEAKARFISDAEFKRWYLDTFGTPFKN